MPVLRVAAGAAIVAVLVTLATMSARKITVYTDGACSGNPGPGGWGWAVAPDGTPRGSGGEPSTTNQRMELTAVLEALRTLTADGVAVGVVSDSTYVVNCFRDRWWEKWERNGWRNSKRQPVANSDLWRPLVELVRGHDVTFEWVKGHSGHPMNELVDRLAVAAIGNERDRDDRDDRDDHGDAPADTLF